MIALRGLYPELRQPAEDAMREAQRAGFVPSVTSVFRSLASQSRLRRNFEQCQERGLVGQRVSLAPNMSCAWPANKPGDSAHNYGLAWDSWVPPDLMPEWIAIREAIGWRVPSNDVIHAELPDWRSYLS